MDTHWSNCAACMAGQRFIDHSCAICDDPDADFCDEFNRLEREWIEALRAIGEWTDDDNSAALDLHPPQPVTSLETT